MGEQEWLVRGSIVLEFSELGRGKGLPLETESKIGFGLRGSTTFCWRLLGAALTDVRNVTVQGIKAKRKRKRGETLAKIDAELEKHDPHYSRVD